MSTNPSTGVLLDTCALIDLVGDPDMVAESIRTRFARPSTRIFVSSASASEVSIKTERGRLPGGAELINAWEPVLRSLRAESLDISHADALDAGSLDWEHRDPFDRMLVAQAKRSHLQLATRDQRILSAGLVDTLDTRL